MQVQLPDRPHRRDTVGGFDQVDMIGGSVKSQNPVALCAKHFGRGTSHAAAAAPPPAVLKAPFKLPQSLCASQVCDLHDSGHTGCAICNSGVCGGLVRTQRNNQGRISHSQDNSSQHSCQVFNLNGLKVGRHGRREAQGTPIEVELAVQGAPAAGARRGGRQWAGRRAGHFPGGPCHRHHCSPTATCHRSRAGGMLADA